MNFRLKPKNIIKFKNKDQWYFAMQLCPSLFLVELISDISIHSFKMITKDRMFKLKMIPYAFSSFAFEFKLTLKDPNIKKEYIFNNARIKGEDDIYEVTYKNLIIINI